MKSHHYNALVLENCGLLIEGPSGAGKSSLTLGLIEKFQKDGLEAGLISDDRVLLSNEDGKLIAEVPISIAGKIELRGYGVVDLPYLRSAEIFLLIRMKEDHSIDRMPEPQRMELLDIRLPVVEVPIRHESASIRIVSSWLKDNMKTKVDLVV